MADKTLADRLSAMGACLDAVQWARGYTDDAAAWRECQRGDWMLWLLGRLGADHKRLALAACGCARLSLHLVAAGEERPRIAIETAEAWARGDGPMLDAVREASAAAAAAANAAVYAAAAKAAAAAANAAYYASVYYAAANAVYAAAAANAAVYAAAAIDTAISTTLSQCADIVRQHFPEVPHVQ